MPTYYCGIQGRVRSGAGNDVMAEFKAWRFRQSVSTLDRTTFESPQTANGYIIAQIACGIVNQTFEASGLFEGNAAANTFSRFGIGDTIVFDMLFDKTTGFGYHNVSVFITEFDSGTNVEGQATFSMNGRIISAVADPANT